MMHELDAFSRGRVHGYSRERRGEMSRYRDVALMSCNVPTEKGLATQKR